MNSIYLLPVSYGQEDDLKRFWLEHDVLDDVISQAVDVQVGQATFVELSLSMKMNDKVDRSDIYKKR